MKNEVYYSSGAKQSDRVLSNLIDQQLLIDDQSDIDFINFIHGFAGILKFWNLQNTPQGDWQPYFQNDLSVLIAHISQTNFSNYASKYHDLYNNYLKTSLNSEKEKILIDFFVMNLGLANQLIIWYDQIKNTAINDAKNEVIETEVSEILRANIGSGIYRMGTCYKSMYYFFSQNPNWIAQLNLESLANKTQYLIHEKFENSAGSVTNNTNENSVDFNSYNDFFEFQIQLFEDLFGSAYLLKEQTKVYFDQSLLQSNHTPHIALALAFREMMAPLQQKLNQYTQKHLDFYYRKVLLQQPKSAGPGEAPVQFTPNPSNQHSFHPKGTTLVALTTPSAQSAIYKTKADLTVTQATPVEYKTIFNPTAASDPATAVKGLMYYCPVANSADGLGASFVAPDISWPTLGADYSTAAPDLRSQHIAPLGFAISNAHLFLSEGNRSITVYLDFGIEAMATIARTMQAMGISWQSTDIISFWENCFQVAYTGANGWVAISGAKVSPFSVLPQDSPASPVEPLHPARPNTLAFSTTTPASPLASPVTGISFFMAIAEGQSPVTTYSTSIHGPGYQAQAPVLRFEIQQQLTVSSSKSSITINPYPILSSLKILRLRLEVEAAQVLDFAVQNDLSLLKLQNPFTPFGVKPVVEGNFYIGNDEIFNKRLTHLQLGVDWYDLPSFPYGFCDYYDAYNLCNPDKPFYNSVFKWGADILIDRKWIPLSIKNAPKTPGGNEDTQNNHDASPPSSPGPGEVSHFSILPAGSKSPGGGAAASSIFSPPAPPETDPARVFPLFDWDAPLPPPLSLIPPQEKTNTDDQDSVASPPSNGPGGLHVTKSSFLPSLGGLINLYKQLRSNVAELSGLEDPSAKEGKPALPDKAPAGTGKTGIFSKILGLAGGLFKNKVVEPELKGLEGQVAGTGKTSIFRKILGAVGNLLIPKKIQQALKEPENKVALPGQQPTPGKTTSANTTDQLDQLDQAAPGSPPSGETPPPPPSGPGASQAPPQSNQPSCLSRGEGKLKPGSVFEFQVQNIPWSQNTQAGAFSPQQKYSDQSAGGFIRFVLKEPVYAFGHDDYAAVISEIANKNLQTIAHGKTATTPASTPQTASKSSPASPDKPSTGSAGSSTQKKISTIGKILKKGLDIISIFSPVASAIDKGVDKVEETASSVEKKVSAPASPPASPPANTGPAAVDFSTLLLPPRLAYVPKIKRLTASYGAAITADYSKAANKANGSIDTYHLHPFGIVQQMDSPNSLSLLPQYDCEGYLYVAIDKVVAPQKISLLFVLNEQSGNRENTPPKVQWSYLSGDQWLPFAAIAVEDGTSGFVRTGIINFDLPQIQMNSQYWFIDKSVNTTKTYYWIRATVKSHATSVCETTGVFPHAAMAMLAGDPSGSAEHVNEPLPANSITRLEQPHSGIDKVTQITASSGHIPKETEAQFYTRVQERLRHKGRAITAWDYERIVLQGFPDIGLVRCLNHTSTDLNAGILPGVTTLVVMPAQISPDDNFLTPKTNLSVITEIKNYLKPIADPFVQIEVRNPAYEFISITAEIKLKNGLDPGQYLNILNKGLINEICPWVDNYQDIHPFEHTFTYFSLLEYLNQPAIIDEVFSFRVYLKSSPDEAEGILLPESFEAIRPRKLWGLVTSSAQHQLVATNKPGIIHAATTKAPVPDTNITTSAASDSKSPQSGGNALFILNNWYNSAR